MRVPFFHHTSAQVPERCYSPLAVTSQVSNLTYTFNPASEEDREETKPFILPQSMKMTVMDKPCSVSPTMTAVVDLHKVQK